jgi:hypothetical protein
MKTFARFPDLKRRGIVNNRVQLARLIKIYGFPAGIKLGPNSRAWDEEEVDAWLSSRPTTPKPAARRKPDSQAAA